MANSADLKKFYGNDSVPNSLTTANTVGTGKTWSVTYVTYTNKTTTPVKVTLKIGGVTIHQNIPIPSESFVDFTMKVVAVAGETIQISASAASSLACTINGVEVA